MLSEEEAFCSRIHCWQPCVPSLQIQKPTGKPHWSLSCHPREYCILAPVAGFYTQWCHTVLGHLLRSPPSLPPAAAKDFCSRPAPPHTPGSTTPDHVLSGAVCGPRTEAAPGEAVGQNSTRGPSRATPTEASINTFPKEARTAFKSRDVAMLNVCWKEPVPLIGEVETY